MRRFAAFLILVLPLAFAPFGSLPAAEESTRTLHLELAVRANDRFAVENLAGTLRVMPGTGTRVVATATVHAESAEQARLVRFEQVPGKNGEPVLRVRYPLDKYPTIRYIDGHAESGAARVLGGALKWIGTSISQTEYDGHKVKVSSKEGPLMFADLEIRVPRVPLDAAFRNQVGAIRADGIEGRLLFDGSSGDVTLEGLKGEIRSDSGSGTVKARKIEGSFDCDTGSGNCELTDFQGERISCDVGSGNVKLKSIRAGKIQADTGSGNIQVSEADLEEFQADTGSGNVVLENHGTRLVRIGADTGSGNVTLRLPPGASFEALADQGSGDIKVRYSDAEPILRRKEVVGYRRGDARIHIDVDTGSGNLIIEPVP